MNASSKKTAQIVVLSIGFAAATLAWSCQNDVRTEGRSDADVSKADVEKAQSPSASDLNQLLHDARLNKPDGLGDYVYDFQAK